jgi:prepilin-type N-terminal cleavage/methylation domain-containing protein
MRTHPGGTGFQPVLPRNQVHPGFTLIEVLIAVIIIGLGMIGLSALFAGAARQQQLVSQSSRAGTAARNTEAKITEVFNGFRDVTDVANCLHGGNVNAVPISDKLGVQWVHVNAAQDNNLSIFAPPVGGNNNACTWAFFERPAQAFFPLDARGAFGPSLSTRLGKDGFTSAANAITNLPGCLPFFPVRSVVGDSLEVDVYVASDNVTPDPDFPVVGSNPGDASVGTVKKYTYVFDPTVNNGCSSSVFTLKPKELHPRFSAQGWLPADAQTQDFIRINARKCPITLDTNAPAFAEIEAMTIFGVNERPNGAFTPARNNRYIQRIVVNPYTYRETNLLSLSDRVVTENTTAGETRDVAGVSVMMRGTDTGSVLVAVFSYALQSTREGARFIPAERAAELGTQREIYRPIRRANVSLVYNSDSESYWFYCSRADSTTLADESWLARTGQTVLFAGDAANNRPGADAMTKVVRVVTLAGNRGFWCELERAPRAGVAIAGLAPNASVPVITAPFTPGSQPGAAGTFLVYGVNAQAASRLPPADSNGTFNDQLEGSAQWQLRPIEGRVFTISR